MIDNDYTQPYNKLQVGKLPITTFTYI